MFDKQSMCFAHFFTKFALSIFELQLGLCFVCVCVCAEQLNCSCELVNNVKLIKDNPFSRNVENSLELSRNLQ